MCLDPRALNKCIVREMIHIPTIDEVRNKLTNKKYFTICDLKDRFYQCELESESMKLCAFSTPFGSYQFRRLPFGLANAPEIFQQLTSPTVVDCSEENKIQKLKQKDWYDKIATYVEK